MSGLLFGGLFRQSTPSISRVKKAGSGDEHLIPLINVVFLMLIFFMVAGQIKRSDVETVQPLESLSDTRQAQEMITLIATLDGSLYLDNQAVDQAGLATGLLVALAQAETPDALVVLVKVDAGLPVDVLQRLLRQIKATGLARVSLATRQLKVAIQ
jgi:biopolymer transport protein ExbD